jgi:hypothetical protein
MTLKIRNDDIYDKTGNWLKTISCPKKLARGDLDEGAEGNFTCQICERTIHNTDFMTEEQIVDLLVHYPDSCLSINLRNPIFQTANLED